jgi:hypothetical protein
LLAEALAIAGARVWAYDPLAGEQARGELPAAVTVTETLEEAVRNVEVVLVCTPDPAFREAAVAALARVERSVTVLDFWRSLESELAEQPSIRYLPAGRCLDGPGAAERVTRLWNERANGVAHETSRRPAEIATALAQRASLQ